MQDVKAAKTALLVDDDEAVRRLIQIVLSASGYHTVEAGDPQSALEKFQKHSGNLHLLVCDVMLPGAMNGLELARHIAKANPGIRVLIISGYSSHNVTLEIGWQFMKKPFVPVDLMKVVQELFRSQDELS